MNDFINTKNCNICGAQFGITRSDLGFYSKVDVPEPLACPDCRQQRRLAAINHLYLFRRNCDLTNQPIVSCIPPELPVKVYSQKIWLSDVVDGNDYGRDFDFSRPFFPQFKDLLLVTPRPSLFTDYLHDENSDYTNYAGRNKDCYLIFDSDENRDCQYSYSINGAVNCVDCYRVQQSELCYEAVDCKGCHSSAYIYNSENCSNSVMLKNCIGCKHCIMCCNLRHKDYYVFNEPVSPEKFETIRKQLGNRQLLQDLLQSFASFMLNVPHKFMRGVQNENVLGDNLVNCKNAIQCFDCRDLWDGKYCYQTFLKAKDCMDVNEVGEAELVYDSIVIGYNAFNVRFSSANLEQISNLTYCDNCRNGCSNLFGCIGLKRKHYCILNKQYSKEAYEKLVGRIISHMKETGEWGGFFSAEATIFPYNISSAQNYFPLEKQEAADLGYLWYERKSGDYLEQRTVVPDLIAEVKDEILNHILACEKCGKNYKINSAELKFYRQMQIPVPKECFECRHHNRLKVRNPLRLWSRRCDNCSTPIQSSYSPKRPEKVYCEKCYLDSLE